MKALLVMLFLVAAVAHAGTDDGAGADQAAASDKVTEASSIDMVRCEKCIKNAADLPLVTQYSPGEVIKTADAIFDTDKDGSHSGKDAHGSR